MPDTRPAMSDRATPELPTTTVQTAPAGAANAVESASGRGTIPADAIEVEAPARLHLGFIDLNGSLGRRFGSIGLAVDAPATRLTVKRASAFASSGPEAARALQAAQRFSQAFAAGAPFAVDVATAIPAHAGLGSGTQLALAIGAAILRHTDPLRQRVASDEPVALAETARLGELAERGARSATGIAAFTGGGFIVDAGKSLAPGLGTRAPPVLMQIPFPESWRAILVLDMRVEGVHGEAETAAFARLPLFPAAAAAHIAHLVLLRLAPALHERDLPAFGSAVTEIQEIVGGYFAAAQGGSAWSSPAVGAIVRRLGGAGAVGIGQSSWGPTGFAFVPDPVSADTLYHSFVEDAKALGLDLMIVRGRNSGARIG